MLVCDNECAMGGGEYTIYLAKEGSHPMFLTWVGDVYQTYKDRRTVRDTPLFSPVLMALSLEIPIAMGIH